MIPGSMGLLAAALIACAADAGAQPQAPVTGPRAGAPPARGDSSVVVWRLQPGGTEERRALAFELRGGIGTGEYHASASAGERTAGASWRVQLSYAPLPFAAAFVGYGRSSFGCEGGFCAQAPVTFTGSGFDAGVRLSWRALWLQAGLLAWQLDAEWMPADGVATRQRADSNPGVLVGAGVDIPVVAGFSVAPGVRWMRHGAAFQPGGADAVVHVVADVGVRYRLPF